MSHERIPWTQRKFKFDYSWELYPEIIERLRGTPARAASLLYDVQPSVLKRRIGERWSVQENIAHLADLDEILWMPRIDQYVHRESRLMEADMTNRTTNEANHNQRSIVEVLERFGHVRERLVAMAERLEHSVFGRSALHPRLNVQMRLTDHLFFVAEHDDYHLAHITDLKRPRSVS